MTILRDAATILPESDPCTVLHLSGHDTKTFGCSGSALHTCLPNEKHIRSRAHTQHCTHACQMMTAPAQEHALSSAPAPANSLKSAPQNLHTCLLKDSHIRSRAHAHYTRLPSGEHTAQEHTLSTAHTHTHSQLPPASEHTQSTAHTQRHKRLPNDKHTRSRAHSKHCTYAFQVTCAPA